MVCSDPKEPHQRAVLEGPQPGAGGSKTFHLSQKNPGPSAAERENTTQTLSSRALLPQNECVRSLMVKQILFSGCFFSFSSFSFLFPHSVLFAVLGGWCRRGSAVGQGLWFGLLLRQGRKPLGCGGGLEVGGAAGGCKRWQYTNIV